MFRYLTNLQVEDPSENYIVRGKQPQNINNRVFHNEKRTTPFFFFFNFQVNLYYTK